MDKTLVQCKLAKAGPSVAVDYPPKFDGRAEARKNEKAFFVGQSPVMLTTAEAELAKKKISDAYGRLQGLAKTGLVMVDANHPLGKAPDSTLELEEKRLGLPPSPFPSRWARVVRIVEAKALAG